MEDGKKRMSVDVQDLVTNLQPCLFRGGARVNPEVQYYNNYAVLIHYAVYGGNASVYITQLHLIDFYTDNVMIIRTLRYRHQDRIHFLP